MTSKQKNVAKKHRKSQARLRRKAFAAKAPKFRIRTGVKPAPAPEGEGIYA